MKVIARHYLVVAGSLAAALFLTACQSQSEGERCDTANGDADCASGLICLANICCTPGLCNAAPTTTGGAGTATTDAAAEGSATMTSEAAASEGAASEAATTDATTSEAATMTSETGAEAAAPTPDAAAE